ncbi:MAG: phosphatidylinositol kinase [Spirochaetaceae bacterium]|nr:MAG: phosphatidylinositol kinase [Spirochaetaceae bacterium]
MNRRGYVYWNNDLAGEIRETDTGYEFAYDHAWLNSPNAQPVSLTLPLRPEPYTSQTMFPFFDGLIPEGWLLSVTAKTWKVDSRDRMGLLLAACRDPIGAVSIRAVEMKAE